jgi:hypothetical protein
MSGRWTVLKRHCNFVGGFHPASHPSIVPRAWTQVLFLAGFLLWATCWTTLSSALLWGDSEPIRTHPKQNARMSGAWGSTLTPRFGKMFLLCCTPITWGREHHEDIKGVRSAMHSVFAWERTTVSRWGLSELSLGDPHVIKLSKEAYLSIKMTKKGHFQCPTTTLRIKIHIQAECTTAL